MIDDKVIVFATTDAVGARFELDFPGLWGARIHQEAIVHRTSRVGFRLEWPSSYAVRRVKSNKISQLAPTLRAVIRLIRCASTFRDVKNPCRDSLKAARRKYVPLPRAAQKRNR